ncbi:MAG: hypothetical protein OXC15_00070 [Rhodospirillaceae bacterium]|nr:hypothetical protein [Rhodospirillaceae bacterium]
MPVHRGNIGEVVLSAWNDAVAPLIKCSTQQETNRERSRAWIRSLAERFREHYEGDRYRVFSLGNKKNREQFGLNELLFDLAVCSVSSTKSLERQPRDLPFIARCHWQIESEFSRQNTRDLIVDMSKLVMGAAENKLFVASHRGDRERDVLDQCAPIAACCGGRVHFCFVSHPDVWENDPESPVLHEWIAGGWVEVAVSAAR